MAGSKKRKSKAKVQTRAKSAPKKAAPRKAKRTPAKAARRLPSAKKVAAKKAPARRALARKLPASKAFAEKVRDCDAGTGIWFITAGSVEHAAIQKRGIDGAVVIRTDAGVTDVVPVGNLFETADEARAARYR